MNVTVRTGTSRKKEGGWLNMHKNNRRTTGVALVRYTTQADNSLSLAHYIPPRLLTPSSRIPLSHACSIGLARLHSFYFLPLILLLPTTTSILSLNLWFTLSSSSEYTYAEHLKLLLPFHLPKNVFYEFIVTRRK